MKTELEGNILMDSKIAMDSMIAAMDQMRAASSEETAEACDAVVSILHILSRAGAKTAEDALNIIRDYRVWVKPDITLEILREYRAMVKLSYAHIFADMPILKDNVWHCPECNGRCKRNHSFCHRCGKKLDWKGDTAWTLKPAPVARHTE